MIRKTGAPSIAVGRTPHELRDEMCRLMAAAPDSGLTRPAARG